MRLRAPIVVFLLVVPFVGLLPLARAVAQPATVAPAGPPAGQGEATYHSPLRLQCEEELRKDKDWYADLKEQCYGAVQNDAARYATTNNRHVIMAYAAFWLLTVGFVVLQWRRQQQLKAEVARLEQELARALKDGASA